MHPRRPICKYAGGAVASGCIVSIQELLQLNLFQGIASPLLLSVTIQIQGSPENELQGIRRVRINLRAPVVTPICSPLVWRRVAVILR